MSSSLHPSPSGCHLALFTWYQTRGSYQKTIPSIQWTTLGSAPRSTPDLSSTYSDWLTIQQRVLRLRGAGGVWYSGEFEGLTLTSGPRSSNKFRPAAQIGLVFPLKTPHPSAEFSPHISFSMIAWGTSIHRRVRVDTDPCYDAHPYLKGSAGDLWVALSGTLGLPSTDRILHNTLVGYFLKLQKYDIKHNELMIFNLSRRHTDDACRCRTKAAICEIQSVDEGVRMTMRMPISLWIQQVTPTWSPITHLFVFSVSQGRL